MSLPLAGVSLKTVSRVVNREGGVSPEVRERVTRLEALGLRSPEAAEQAVRQLLRRQDPPTALFAGRNDLAVGATRALRGLGLTRSVAIIGFDDFPLADLLTPGMTVVRQNVSQIGAEAGRLIFARIEGDTAPPRRVIIEPTLVVRGSGEIAAPA